MLTAEFIVTFTVFILACSGLGWLLWLERKPRHSLAPRLLPTTPLLIISGMTAILALVHVINLLGIHTGR